MKLSIKTKIILSIIIAFVVLSFFISYFSYREARTSIENLTCNHLYSILSTMSGWISDKFSTLKEDILFFSVSPSVVSLSYNIKTLFKDIEDQDTFFKAVRNSILKNNKTTNGVISTNYLLFSKKLMKLTKHYLDMKKTYENIIFIDVKSGYIFFEDTPLDDFGTSLYKDVYRSSPLAKVFHKARKLRNGEVFFGEFTKNPLYGNKSVAFLATPVYKDGKPDTVCVFVIGESTLRKILIHATKGNRDFDVYVLIEGLNSIVGITPSGIIPHDKIDIAFARKLFSGTGGVLINEKEDSYVNVYKPMTIFGQRWAVVGQVPKYIAFKNAKKMRQTIFYISFISIFIFTVILYLQLSKIVSPIGKLTNIIVRITNKELPLDTDIKMKTGDEIEILAESFGKLLKLLKEEIDTLNKFINTLNGEIRNLENIVEKEEEVVTTQATNITELASTIEEFSKTMESITGVNERALEEFKILRESAMENYDAQEKVIEGMRDLKKEMKNTFSLFEKITKMNEDIRGIADIIDNVAEQIKIIAFNASLEAARAGEAGKGFSVIAAQIRELLENISKQNVEIKKLIDENSANIVKISESSDKMSYFLDVEESNVNTISEFIENVLRLIEKNEEFISSIFISQKQQKIAIQEFTASLNESKEKIEEGRSLARDIAESVAVLRELVDELIEVKNKMIR